MKFSLFRSGPVPRLLIAVAYAVLAFGAVALVEHASARRALRNQSPAATSPTNTNFPAARDVPLHIEIEAVNPVASWTVRLDSVIITPSEKSPTTWDATITTASAAARLEIDASRAPDATAATNALRLRVARGAARLERTLWCGSGDCVFEVPLRDLASPSGAPAATPPP
jgi:hypothetical protein